MINDLRIDEPESGFRYTHNVLWHGQLVGHATEVTPRPQCDAFSWYAFVQFDASGKACAAVASADVQEAVHCWRPSGCRAATRDNAIAAQYVVLRGYDRDGAFQLVPKDRPVPIPGVAPPDDDQDFQLRKEFQPEVVAW